MRNIARLMGLLVGAAMLSPAAAQPAQDLSQMTEQTTDLGHGMMAIVGVDDRPGAPTAGDITVAVGSDGIIVVDTQFAPLYDRIMAKIRAMSPLPIKYVIDTHAHGDHTGGNALFAKEGAVIVAHANVLKSMTAPATGGQPAAPVNILSLPVQTYSGQGTEVKIPGQTAELVHLENAHTDGDTVVFWPAANVISTGDTLHRPGYPNIDTRSGGGIDGMIAAADFIVAHSDAKTRIVPGHGPVTDKAGAIAYRDMLVMARARIAKAKAEGMTEQQVTDAHLLVDLDKYWKLPNATSERFPINVYRSIK